MEGVGLDGVETARPTEPPMEPAEGDVLGSEVGAANPIGDKAAGATPAPTRAFEVPPPPPQRPRRRFNK